jgi:putative oxidoreductase
VNPATLIPSHILIPLGRVVLASLFMLGGLNKILNYNDTLIMMRGAGLEPAALLLPPTILLELGGGVLVAFGRRFAAPAALALAVFTVVTNIVFHGFWSMHGPEAMLQLSLFFKNISIAGGLLYVAGISAHRDTQ